MADGDSKTDPTEAPATAGGPMSGGVSGEHPRPVRPLYIAPTQDDGLNTLRFPLRPIACWRLEDLRFEFDSSFVRPEAAVEMRSLSTLREAHPGAPASLFGHADPVGDDGYNKTLSGRRALAVYALLVRDVARWEDLYSHPFGGDAWGARAVQRMLGAVGFDPGIVDGKVGPKTRGAVKQYQSSKGLDVDGDAGPETRKALFADYMDALCRGDDGQAYQLDPEADFLNRGADADLRGDVQGCGEHNPLLVFSSDEDQDLSRPENKAERDSENLGNRRVLVFLFPPGSQIDAQTWPCPAAADGPSKCKAQFWPDGDARRSPQETRRVYGTTRDTMACRFYDRMARRSPCEVVRSALRLRLLNSENDYIPHAPYRLVLASGEERDGQADELGWLVEQNIETPERVHVEWGYPTQYGITDEERARRWAFEGPYGYGLDVAVHSDADLSKEDEAELHLGNLGYPQDRSLEENVLSFQRDYQVYPANGDLSDETSEALAKVDNEGLSRDEYLSQKNSG